MLRMGQLQPRCGIRMAWSRKSETTFLLKANREEADRRTKGSLFLTMIYRTSAAEAALGSRSLMLSCV